MTMYSHGPAREARKLPYFAQGYEFGEPYPVGDAFLMAGLEFELEQRPIYIQDHTDVVAHWARPTKYIELSEQHRAVVRTDTQQTLGVVGGRYEIVQNEQIADLLVRAGWDCWAAGSIDDGRKGFAVLHGGPYSEFTVNGDPFFAHIVARWNHDGSGTVRVGPQIWRQWCTNAAKRIEAQKWVTVRHTISAERNMIAARELMPQLETAIGAFKTEVQTQMATRIDFNTVLDKVFPRPKDKETIASTTRSLNNWSKTIGQVRANASHSTLQPFFGTAYQAIQAINEHEQWNARTKNLARSQILRLDADRFPLTEKALALVAA